MKKIFLAAAVAGFFFVACEKEDMGCENSVKVKLLRATCSQIVVQVLDSAYYNLGENGWQSNYDGEAAYDHVFTIKNYCEISEKIASSYNIGDVSGNGYPLDISEKNITFSVRIKDTFSDSCAVCAALFSPAPPKTSYAVEICK